MKIISKLTLMLLLSGFTFGASSCSSFFGDNTGMTISDIKSQLNQDGSTTILISFTDDKIEPVTFNIPKGVGVSNVEAINNDDGTITIIFNYSDGSDPSTFTIPVLKGENGKGVETVDWKFDEDGNTIINIKYTDGSTSGDIPINKGKDGIGISSYEYTYDEENETAYLNINFTDGKNINVPIKNGKDGAGIEDIKIDESLDDYYIFNITYTNGEEGVFTLSKPEANSWLNGNGAPSNSIGKNNDFYFNDQDGSVYKKINGIWTKLFSMSNLGEQKVIYEVTFKLNGGQWRFTDQLNPDSVSQDKTVSVESGSYIDLNNENFAAIYEGHNFEGWWTDPIVTANSGHFTNLTPVFGNLTLYAIWSAN